MAESSLKVIVGVVVIAGHCLPAGQPVGHVGVRIISIQPGQRERRPAHYKALAAQVRTTGAQFVARSDPRGIGEIGANIEKLVGGKREQVGVRERQISENSIGERDRSRVSFRSRISRRVMLAAVGQVQELVQTLGTSLIEYCR